MERQYVIDDSMSVLRLAGSAVAEISGVRIPTETPAELLELRKKAVEYALQLDEATDEILASYRGLVSRIGRSPKRFPPAAQKLIQQVKRKGDLPAINVAIDCYNIVVLESRLAFGVHDSRLVEGNVSFHRSPGGEPFRPVGSDSVKFTLAGDYVYVDRKKVLAWLDSYDSDDAKVSQGTENIVLVVQGTDRTPPAYTLTALRQACELITRYCGGEAETTTLL